MITENPITKFNQWWKQALTNSPLKQKSAVCVSTIDENGYPSSRFVDLKAVNSEGFTFCTYRDSPKGNHLKLDAKVALTAWWDHMGLQVRVVGKAQNTSDEISDCYWLQRSHSAQVATQCFEQSQPIASESTLRAQFEQASEMYSHKPVPRPHNWGGITVSPKKIEFLTFQQTRLHLREAFYLNNDSWEVTLLQP
ncbi:pyridoxine/pyridoxamine 5'-phosphate oxidase [Alteromonas sp. ASW11-130]|uniref:pyridoxine/pyridoxamine 5'-phosphate oxidase n=1 Tax=Alteromonas sp. ASW11-130 TaxID=3015775 RepID=UPI002241D6B3|nr:pyridoxal 5'-phosphate synthase [Alteromonas sp. ASW11-130]MCW8092585.1 pyridoxal 5'-phosphate synthase [Alteromonas sp. ASW11-130]